MVPPPEQPSSVHSTTFPPVAAQLALDRCHVLSTDPHRRVVPDTALAVGHQHVLVDPE